MPEDKSNILSLKELQTGVKEALNLNFPEYIWVYAELSEVNSTQNGHCYIELIEKSGEQIIAKTRGTIWNFTFRMLKPYFESSTGYEFAAGIKVSLKVAVEFHEVYGLSLNVKDIDPVYTVGDIELQKRKIINRLSDDGVIDMNAEIELPLVVQNIAVISSPTAAGYGDFVDQIENNPNNYHFNHELFESKMQGPDTGKSIISALDNIYSQESKFDVVIIIRGGGSKMDLAGFDDYELASNIAQFPLPIITGIGHERDESIADIVSHHSLKTPTAVAEFLITEMQYFENRIDEASSQIIQHTNFIIEKNTSQLEKNTQDLMFLSQHILNSNKTQLGILGQQFSRGIKNLNNISVRQLEHHSQQIKYHSLRILSRADERLELIKSQLTQNKESIFEKKERRLLQIEQLNNAFDPKRILKSGFAMIEQEDKILVSVKSINKSKDLSIIMNDGKYKIKNS